MSDKELLEILEEGIASLKKQGVIRYQRDLARLLDVNEVTVSRALKGTPHYLTPNLVAKVQALANGSTDTSVPKEWVKEYPSIDSALNRKEIVVSAFNSLRNSGVAHTQKDFARLIGFSEGTISKALQGEQRFLTDSLISKIQEFFDGAQSAVPAEWVREFTSIDTKAVAVPEKDATIPVLPIAAHGGAFSGFAEAIASRACERALTPIENADLIVPIYGDSMSPRYPSGSRVVVKKVNERAFLEWGKTYVLDTVNGAVIKQVMPGNDNESIVCRSFNENYPPFIVALEDIRGFYKVLMTMIPE